MNKQTQIAIVKFNNAKATHAVPMTAAQDAIVTRGQELGDAAADSHAQWVDALKVIGADHAKRMLLRAGFLSTYCAARSVGEDSGIWMFNKLCRVHAPESSRKAKSNAKRKAGGGRKAKVETGKASKLSEKDVAQRLVRCLAYVAKAQAKHAGDDEMLEVLGDIAAILGGKAQ